MSWQATRAAILDGWAAATVFGTWVGSHSNKLAVAARAGYLMAAGLGWTHLTLTQFALVAGFGEAVLAVFVESTMVSKQRMGERQSNALQVRVELQADCFAGVWANKAQEAKSIFEPGDIEAALNAASAIGDDRIQKQTQGYVVPDAFTHGSSAQRVRWFKRGFRTGDLNQCDTFNADEL